MVIRNEPPRYRVYMIRCWEIRSPQPTERVTWRFSLQDAHTGQMRGFADLETLTAFIQAELEETASTR